MIVDDLSFFLVELDTCAISGQSLECALFVTNTMSDDNTFGINNQTRAFDNSGYEYQASVRRIANSEEDYIRKEKLSKTLISGVRTPAILRFASVSKEAEKVASLELYCYLASEETSLIKFRDIPIERN